MTFTEYHNLNCNVVTLTQLTTAVLLQQEHHPEDGRNMLVRTLDKIQHGILKYMSYGFRGVGRDYKICQIARVVLKPATRIPLQPNQTETPTHIETRTIRPMR